MIPVIYKKPNFLKTLQYVLGKEDAAIIQTNMAGRTPDEFNQQFLNTKYSNKSVKRQCAHLIISIAHRQDYHEHLSDSQYCYVAQEYLKDLGYLPKNELVTEAESQYVAVRHHDRDHEHLHIIASRIRLDGSLVRDSYDYFNSQVSTRRLAAQLGLEVTPTTNKSIANRLKQEYGINTPISPNRSKSIRAVNSKHKTPTSKEVIREAIAEAIENSPNRDISTFIEHLEKSRVQVLPKLREKELLGFSYIHENVIIAGHQVYKPYSWKNLQVEFGFEYNPQRDYDSLVKARSRGQELLLTPSITKSTNNNSDDGNHDSQQIVNTPALNENNQNQEVSNIIAIPVLLEENQPKKGTSGANKSLKEENTSTDITLRQKEEDLAPQTKINPLDITDTATEYRKQVRVAIDTLYDSKTNLEKLNKVTSYEVQKQPLTSNEANKREIADIVKPPQPSIPAENTSAPTPQPQHVNLIPSINQISTEDKLWAESLLPTIGKIWHKANQSGKVKLLAGGMKQVNGKEYTLTVDNGNKLTVSSIINNREIATYDLDKNILIAAKPQNSDKQYWERLANKQLATHQNKAVEI
ncbi:hypothetical protein RIVM261_077900 [Rivularia sp. IAM M-261]|nr:hypothetical protein RIVM261_077900 [Rivularia sp. IAM M-261]